MSTEPYAGSKRSFVVTSKPHNTPAPSGWADSFSLS